VRLGVLDVGSNTIHLQVVDTHPGARPNPTFNFKEELSLTEYLNEKNEINNEGIALLRKSIGNAVLQARTVQVKEFLPFATSALREAANSEKIISDINKEFDIDLQVLGQVEDY
jgi:exopolyphosphatase/guanosine-5'-triphosphate,3'-diphosphate pyrophosphatase